jgi:hypothetical protein
VSSSGAKPYFVDLCGHPHRAPETLLRPRYLELAHNGVIFTGASTVPVLPLSRDADTLPVPGTIGRTFRLIQRPRHMERPVR